MARGGRADRRRADAAFIAVTAGVATPGTSNRGVLAVLAPMPTDRRVRRFSQLLVGLLLYGVTMGMMVRALLGLDPWDVFHQGLTKLLGQWIDISYGTVITIISVLVLLAWIPLRQRPGVGTVLNTLLIGWTADATLAVLPATDAWPPRVALLIGSVLLNALAGALYIGAGLGPGPRDGLMTGLAARGFASLRVVRTCIELTVFGAGWLLGGAVGVGTVVYALSIGPLLQLLLPRVAVRSLASARGGAGASSGESVPSPPGASAHADASIDPGTVADLEGR